MSLWNGKMICLTKHPLPTEQIAQLCSCSLSKSGIIALSPQLHHQRLPPCKRVSWEVFQLLRGAARPTLHFFRQKAWKNRNTQTAVSCLNTACISVWGEEIVVEIGQPIVSSLGFGLVCCFPPGPNFINLPSSWVTVTQNLKWWEAQLVSVTEHWL